MDLQKIKKTSERKTVAISIRTFPSFSKWMRENDLSPNGIFNEAVKDLMDRLKNEK